MTPVNPSLNPTHWIPYESQGVLDTLRSWEEENPEEEHRKIAKERMIIALQYQSHRLDLEGLSLSTLPDIFQCSRFNHLQSLHLAGNHLKSLPESLCELPIENLELMENRLESLPSNFGKLRNLLKVDLMQNLLQTLPSSFAELEALTELGLNRNHLESLPEDFGKLQSLKRLSLKFNKLQKLPESFSLLKDLQVLSLSFNPLETVPKDFCQLPLKRLGITAVQLPHSQINHVIGELSELEFLSLTLSTEKPLPETIFHLQKLQDLNLYNSPKILEIPPGAVQDILKLPQTCHISIREENEEPWEALVHPILKLACQEGYTGPKPYF